jgi:hypothetical protein
MNKQTLSRFSGPARTIAIQLIVALVLFEIGSYFVLKYLVYPRNPSAFYHRPEIAEDEYKQYLRDRHSVLGWPGSPKSDNISPNSSDSRHTPSFPEVGNECVSTFGDSYTYGDEVDDHQAWGNRLSERLQCRVANFGVGGYGTDQAVIRFIDQSNDPSRVAILGIFPHNVLRNVNQYRYFLTGSSRFGFKPRFVIADGNLRRIPIPDLSYEELQTSLSNPGVHFQYESFIPESELGPIILKFPYSRVFVKYGTSEPVRYYIQGWPGWRGYVTRNHSSGALELTAAIVQYFARTAKQRGKSSLVVLFPTAGSFEAYLESGEIAYQQLLDIMSMEGVAFLDLHALAKEYLGDRKFCALLTDEKNCIGHFNPEGNQFVADALAHRIASDNLLK